MLRAQKDKRLDERAKEAKERSKKAAEHVGIRIAMIQQDGEQNQDENEDRAHTRGSYPQNSPMAYFLCCESQS